MARKSTVTWLFWVLVLSQQQISSKIQELNSPKTVVLFVTHSFKPMSRMCTLQVILLVIPTGQLVVVPELSIGLLLLIRALMPRLTCWVSLFHMGRFPFSGPDITTNQSTLWEMVRIKKSMCKVTFPRTTLLLTTSTRPTKLWLYRARTTQRRHSLSWKL